MIGRITRNSPGKTIGKVFDLVFMRRQEDILSASDIFGDFDLAEAEKEGLSIIERIQLQSAKKHINHRLIYRLDRIRHQKQLSEQRQEEARKQREKYEKELIVNDMPDSVQLLVDTRILGTLDMSYKEFQYEFKNETQILRMMQAGDDWIDEQSANNKQKTELMKFMDHSEEDMSLLTWIEAQAMIRLFRSTEPITEYQRKYLLMVKSKHTINNSYNIPMNWDIPKTKKKASQIIKMLQSGVPMDKINTRVKYGRA